VLYLFPVQLPFVGSGPVAPGERQARRDECLDDGPGGAGRGEGVHQKGHSPAHARVGIEGDFVAVVVDQADGQPGT